MARGYGERRLTASARASLDHTIREGNSTISDLAVLSYNLCVLFQRRLGWLDRVTAATLRFRLFTTGGIISQTAGRTTIRLSVPKSERGWWREVLTKLRCEFPNCNVVSQTPG